MIMGYNYAVLGAGRQGIAAAYDMARFGEAEEILLIDVDGEAANQGAQRVNALVGKDIVRPIRTDANNTDSLRPYLIETTSILSALPYKFNPGITDIALDVGANLCDLGGHTGIVRKQLEKDNIAQDAGISIVPDCGMGPGMNISLATYAMSLMDEPKEVRIWDGGLPLNPVPPWNYALSFNINGLTNEYYGNAYFLREGKVTEVPCFDGYEVLDFPEPIGQLEAFVTSGGLSTAPWTFQGKLDVLENKTLRFPGHFSQFSSYSQLGLFDEEPIKVDVDGQTIVPRDVFHSLLAPKITKPEVKDFAIMVVKCSGIKNGNEEEAAIVLIDQFDEKTGFTAMQRLTGWHASIMAILQTKGTVPKGAIPVELAIPGKIIAEEAEKRGLAIEVNTSFDQ